MKHLWQISKQLSLSNRMIGIEQLLQLPAPVVLASGSPRRRELLATLGLNFTVHVSDVDESVISEALPPAEYVQQLSLLKAQRVADIRTDNSIVIGADTTVVLDGAVLNKPTTAEDAIDMLQRLSARTHTVYTGVTVLYKGNVVQQAKATLVTFRELEKTEIEAYVAAGSPMDKAGAYGIQDDFGAVFVEYIEGDYFNIVGLPLQMLYQMLKGLA